MAEEKAQDTVTVSNVSKSDRTFPSGDTIAVGQSGEVPAGDLEHLVVKGWLSDGAIKKGEIEAESPAKAGTDADAVKSVAKDNAKTAKKNDTNA